MINQLGPFGKMSRLALMLAVGFLGALLLGLAAFHDGVLAAGDPWRLWQMGLEPAIVIYLLGTYPLLSRRWAHATDALRPLATQLELVNGAAHPVRRRGAWTALLCGALFAIWATGLQSFHGRWLPAYLLASNMVMFALMGLAIYDGSVRARKLRRIVRAGLQLDLFDSTALIPLARWGQGVSLVFVGGTCLSLLFQSFETLHTVQSLVIYSILIAVSLTLFLTSIWNIHIALVAAQKRELTVIHEHWLRARSEFKQRLAQNGAKEASGLYEKMVVLGGYKSMVLTASTWPFNPKIVREVLASLVAPILIYGLKIAMGLSGGAWR